MEGDFLKEGGMRDFVGKEEATIRNLGYEFVCSWFCIALFNS